MYQKRYIVFIVRLLVILPIWAQQIVMTELPTQKLLPVAHIHRMLQDSEGYMWYGTEGGGLCRDNGYQIDVFRSDLNTPHLLASNDITCITEDRNQQIWFGTKRGLYKLDKTNYQIAEVADRKIGKQQIDAVLSVSDGSTWVASEGMIYHYSHEGRLLDGHPSVWNQNRFNVADFYEDSQHTLWVLQWGGGILRYDPKTEHFSPCQWPCEASPTQMVEDSTNHCYWVATWGKGIVRFSPEGSNPAKKAVCELQLATLEGAAQSPHKAQVLSVLKESRQDILWVSAMDDLYAYRIVNNKLERIATESFLPRNKKILDRLIEDRTGNIWVPAYSPHSFILSFDSNKLKRYPVSAMSSITGYPVMADRTIQEKDYYWIWQGRTGLSLYHPASEQIVFTTDFPSEMGNTYVTKCIEPCRTQPGIWAACNNARVVHLQHEGMRMKQVKEISLPKARQVHVLKEDQYGNLWIGTEDTVYCYDTSTDKVTKFYSGNGSVKEIAITSDRAIYCITENSEFLYIKPNGDRRVIAQGESYSSITLAPNGSLWVGALEGKVYSYHPQSGEMVQEVSASNVNGDAVKGISADHLGHVWILADQYVKEYNPKNQSFRLLHNSDRFIQVDYFLSIQPAAGGNVCLGGIGAFCEVMPSAELDESPDRILPVISSVKIDGKMQLTGMNTAQLEVSPYSTNIEVTFSTLEHLHAQQISYAYRLKGWDSNWNYLPPGTNIAYFTKLPKGNYTLEIKATDIHGCWAQPESCLQINRLPGWYETWWAYTFYMLAAVLIVTGLLRFYFKRLHRKQHEQMEERLTQMKFRFFTNISHELRTPLTLIITPLNSLLPDLQDGKLRQQLSGIYRNAQELLQLVNQLLDFRKLEMKGEKLHLMHGDIHEFIASTCEAFQSYADNQQIHLAVSPTAQPLYMYFDRQKVHRMLYNLLNNAFKFTPAGGSIAVSMESLTRNAIPYIYVSIRDTGKGIAPTDLPHIFDRYYRVSANDGQQEATGSGIGLHLVKEYTELHQGFIEVDSRPGEGSEFRIYLPTNLTGEQLLPDQEELSGELNETPIPQADGRKTILLVEDNNEFRQFMYQQLSQGYNVRQASNGAEAEAIAREQEVDIVVSDVMMPGMSGFELCQRLKQDVKTSHLFVILLTARTGDQSELEGYQAGADCYLTKPFNMDILNNRIRHLLALQQKRKQIFLSEIEVRSEELTSSKVDEEFLRKAVELVEKNLDNSDYSVERFSEDMCMSRMNLYRKLQSITGQKPTEFIRSIRLKKAARLISNGGLTIVEISERVGFASPSYFSKCFKEMFGVLPTQYH